MNRFLIATLSAGGLLAGHAQAALYSESFTGDGISSLVGTTVGGTAGDAVWKKSETAAGALATNGNLGSSSFFGSIYHAFNPVAGTTYRFAVVMDWSNAATVGGLSMGFLSDRFESIYAQTSPVDLTARDRLDSNVDNRGYLSVSATSVTAYQPRTDPSLSDTTFIAPTAVGSSTDISTTISLQTFTFQIDLAMAANGLSYTLDYLASDGTDTFTSSYTESDATDLDIGYAAIGFRNPSGNDAIKSWSIEVIPEPASMGLLALGGGLLFLRRKR